jgi:large subunit ribosomal protein L23
MRNIFEILRRPMITEKSMGMKESVRTLCFQVAPDATKSEIREAIEEAFKDLRGKVDSVRTANFPGKERRRGRTSGHRPDWKKAYVKLKPGTKLPEFGESA